MLDAQVGNLLGPRPGVVEEQQQRPVPQGESPIAGQASEELLDFVAFEVARLGRSGSLHRDGHHPLTDSEHLWVTAGDVVEEGVQCRQALVAGSGVVTSVLFQVAEEAEDALEAEVTDVELGDLGALVGGDEAQQESHGVSVAAHRRWAETFHRDQVVDEERVHERAERRSVGHVVASVQAGSAKTSNRRFASASSSGVMVR